MEHERPAARRAVSVRAVKALFDQLDADRDSFFSNHDVRRFVADQQRKWRRCASRFLQASPSFNLDRIERAMLAAAAKSNGTDNGDSTNTNRNTNIAALARLRAHTGMARTTTMMARKHLKASEAAAEQEQPMSSSCKMSRADLFRACRTVNEFRDAWIELLEMTAPGQVHDAPSRCGRQPRTTCEKKRARDPHSVATQRILLQPLSPRRTFRIVHDDKSVAPLRKHLKEQLEEQEGDREVAAATAKPRAPAAAVAESFEDAMESVVKQVSNTCGVKHFSFALRSSMEDKHLRPISKNRIRLHSSASVVTRKPDPLDENRAAFLHLRDHIFRPSWQKQGEQRRGFCGGNVDSRFSMKRSKCKDRHDTGDKSYLTPPRTRFDVERARLRDRLEAEAAIGKRAALTQSQLQDVLYNRNFMRMRPPFRCVNHVKAAPPSKSIFSGTFSRAEREIMMQLGFAAADWSESAAAKRRACISRAVRRSALERSVAALNREKDGTVPPERRWKSAMSGGARNARKKKSPMRVSSPGRTYVLPTDRASFVSTVT